EWTLGDAAPGELIERGRGAVVVDGQALDERGRCAARPERLEVALHRLDGTTHLVVRGGDRLAAHRCSPLPPPRVALPIRVPPGCPAATRVMLSGWLRSNTTIGRSFSMQRETAAASMTLSWSRRRSAYSSSA